MTSAPTPLLSPGSVRSALRPALAPVAAAYAVALGCVVVVVLLLADDAGGPLDHLRAATLVVGASLRAWVFTQVEGQSVDDDPEFASSDGDLDLDSSDSGELSMAYLVVPLLITGVLLGLTARSSRRSELERPCGTGQQLAATTAVTAAVGLAGVVALTLLARTGDVFGAYDTSVVDEDASVSVTYGVELASLLLWGFPLLLLAGLVGRLSAWVPRTRGVSMLTEARRLTAGVSDWFGIAALHAVLTGLVGTAVVVIPYLISQSNGLDDPGRADLLGGAVLALLLAPTYVLAVAGLGLGIQGGVGGGFGGGDRFGLLSDAVDDRFLLGLLVPFAFALLLGTRRALRSDPTATFAGEAARAAAGFVAFWVAVSLVVVAGARTEIFGSTEFVLGAKAITLVLAPALWGVLTVVLGQAFAGRSRPSATRA